MFNFNNYEVLSYSEAIDMRKSFDGLLVIIQRELKRDPLEPRLYLFFNKRRNYLKLLFWDRTGYCVVSKKLERGGFEIPRGMLDLQKLKLIFDGIGVCINK